MKLEKLNSVNAEALNNDEMKNAIGGRMEMISTVGGSYTDLNYTTWNYDSDRQDTENGNTTYLGMVKS